MGKTLRAWLGIYTKHTGHPVCGGVIGYRSWFRRHRRDGDVPFVADRGSSAVTSLSLQPP